MVRLLFARQNISTFNVPDYREKTFWFNRGHSSGYTYNGYAPNIIGEYLCETGVPGFATNAFFNTGSENRSVFAGAAWGQYMHFDASRSSYIYGNSHDSLLPDDAIVPRSLSCRGLIKY